MGHPGDQADLQQDPVPPPCEALTPRLFACDPPGEHTHPDERSMSDDFDATPYVRPPILDVPSGVALGVALLSALPKSAPDHVKKAAKKLRRDILALQLAWANSDASPTPADRRKADMRIDNAWAILLDRLEAY